MDTTAIRKLVGRHFVVGFDGLEVNDSIREMIQTYYVGSIILFSRNIESPKQVFQLIQELQQLAEEAGYVHPILISVDQENGVIRRLVNGMSLLPGAMSLGSTQNPLYAEESYRASAEELSKLGITWNLAPVADVNNNPDNPVIGVRSFGDNPKIVANFVANAVEGIQREIAATLKHFPGHGDTTVDSHLSLPIIEHDLTHLRQNEFIPFKSGIKAGAASIMLAHVYFPKIEAERVPASLSNKVVNILRKELDYQGVIVTDCLEMNAIAETIGTETAGVKALENGIDIAMISHTFEKQASTIKRAIKKATEDSAFLTILKESDKRVLAFYQKHGRWTNQETFDSDNFLAMVNNHEKLAREIYQKSEMFSQMPSITWKKDESLLVITFENTIFSKVEDPNHLAVPLEKVISEYSDNFRIYTVSNEDTVETTIKKIGDISSSYDHLLMTTYNIRSDKDKQALIYQALHEKTSEIALIALRNPYDAKWVSDLFAYITPFEFTEEAVRVAVAGLYKGVESK